MNKNCKAVISIYLTLTFVCIMSLILALTESSRIRGAALYYQHASNNAIDSMMSLYHKDLWDKYRIFGIEYNTPSLLIDEYVNYLNIHLNNPTNKRENYYNAKLKNETKMDMLRVLDRYNFEDEVIDYMTFALGGVAIDIFGELRNIFTESDACNISSLLEYSTKESTYKENLTEISKEYEIDSKEFLKLDKSVLDANSQIQAINNNLTSLSRYASTASFDEIIPCIDTIEDSISALLKEKDKYETYSNELKDLISSYEDKYNISKSKYGEDECTVIETQISLYKDYFNNNDVKTIESNFEAKVRESENISNLLNELRELMDMYYLELSEASDIEDDSERRATIREIRSTYGGYLKSYVERINSVKVNSILVLSNGLNRSLLSMLQNIKDILESNFLELVLPDGFKIPDFNFYKKDFSISSNLNPLSKFLFTEYNVCLFNYYNRGAFHKTKLKTTESAYEIEYIISGCNTNEECLKNVLYRILAVREGANIVHILTSKDKMKIVTNSLALISPNPVLASAFTFFFVTVWALLQSIYDLKLLCNAKRVPLIHNEESWDIDGNSIFSKGLDLLKQEKDVTKGLNYIDYLRMFLFSANPFTQVERTANIIENNIKVDEAEFDLNNLAYSMKYTNTFQVYPLMSLFKVFDKINVNRMTGYDITIDTYQSYASSKRKEDE